MISARRETVWATSIISLLRYIQSAATDANPNLERRATILFFTFADGKDQIIAFGAADYSPSASEFDADQPVVCPVLGGTGKYMGARGQVTSTRNVDGS